MAKLKNKTVIYEALAMRDETREEIRRAAMKPQYSRKRILSLSKVMAAAVSVFLICIIGAGGFFLFRFMAPNFGAGPGEGTAQSTSLVPTTMLPQPTTVPLVQVAPIPSLQNLDFKIYATNGMSAVIDNITIYSVVRIDDKNGTQVEVMAHTNYTVTQANDITSQLPVLTLIYDDGTQKDLQYFNSAYQTDGTLYMSFISSGLPASNLFQINAADGSTIPVTLTAVTDADCPHISTISMDGAALSVIPLPGPGSVCATEFSDPFTSDIVNMYKLGVQIGSTFVMTPDAGGTDSGNTLYLGGFAGLTGVGSVDGSENGSGYVVHPNDAESLAANPSRISLRSITIFANLSKTATFVVPEDGQTTTLDYPMFDMDNVQFKVTSITNQGGTISIQTETTDNSGNAYRTKAQFYCYVYGQQNGRNTALDTQTTDSNFIPVNPLVINPGTLQPGDSFTITLGIIRYVYGWDYTSDPQGINNPNPPILGTINLQ